MRGWISTRGRTATLPNPSNAVALNTCLEPAVIVASTGVNEIDSTKAGALVTVVEFNTVPAGVVTVIVMTDALVEFNCASVVPLTVVFDGVIFAPLSAVKLST